MLLIPSFCVSEALFCSTDTMLRRESIVPFLVSIVSVVIIVKTRDTRLLTFRMCDEESFG